MENTPKRIMLALRMPPDIVRYLRSIETEGGYTRLIEKQIERSAAYKRFLENQKGGK